MKMKSSEIESLIEEIRASAGCRTDLDSLITRLEQATGYPEIGMLIFCPPDGKERSAREIVDFALARGRSGGTD